MDKMVGSDSNPLPGLRARPLPQAGEVTLAVRILSCLKAGFSLKGVPCVPLKCEQRLERLTKEKLFAWAVRDSTSVRRN